VEPDVLPLVPVCSEYFAHEVIVYEEGCTIQQFCTQKRLNPKAFNMFLTVEHLPDERRDIQSRDIILMDRVFCVCMRNNHIHARLIALH
jgi:hypothetical protein